MTRSPSGIEQEAKKVGLMAANKSATDNNVIQVLCALVEELANNVERLERQVQELLRKQK